MEKERNQRRHLENLLKNQRSSHSSSQKVPSQYSQTILALQNENQELKDTICQLQEDVQVLSENISNYNRTDKSEQSARHHYYNEFSPLRTKE